MVGEIDAKEIDRELIAERLEKQVNSERSFNQIAEKFKKIDFSAARSFLSGRKGHQLSLTCLAFVQPKMIKQSLTKNSKSLHEEKLPLYIYSASKDAVIVKWDFWTGEKIHIVPGNLKPTKRLARQIGKKNLPTKEDGHCDEIWCMDASSDGKFIVSRFTTLPHFLPF
jgi:ribosomal RNA-processing protein 9